jgi:thiamine biosynthesis lipoprotein
VLSIWHDARENAACTESLDGVLTCPVPSDEVLAGPFATDLSDLLLDAETRSVAFAEPGMALDLGGFAKGYVSEIVTDYLDGLSVDYIFNAGNSNVKSGGVNPNNDTGLYYIALMRPAYGASLESDYYAYLQVPGGMALVTSGSDQRFFVGAADGEIYHHIIDPRTNRPGGEAMAVTIILEDGAKGDAYSTAIFLLSVADGLAFVEATPGLEAVWYLKDGTVVSSSGMGNYVYQWVDDATA